MMFTSTHPPGAEATYTSSAAPGQSPSTQRARSQMRSGMCNSGRQERGLSPVIPTPAKALSPNTVPVESCSAPLQGMSTSVPVAVRSPVAMYTHSTASQFQHSLPFLPAGVWAIAPVTCVGPPVAPVSFQDYLGQGMTYHSSGPQRR